ncbi:TRAP transporter small permease subunit [Rhizobium sp. SEMIA 4085]|jgi:TRAP-type mannitol/chloroaromatic compound transport system permease small subunit|uniref:TRAP transporter small permease protein n=1 Tax=Rhizobium gallicum bv. gallicum R602sp TaxID=1041138 RepID=A0A0B4XFN5_9HYPH|nr:MULTISPECIES: TRAP transporter small permease subunit [Rhizobium]AJD45560.1 TRAP dicarboxylate transporter protein DctQ subunit [Rhizobium gallicum bv. gallicum R602sp]NNH30351.1 TRAP transporter small permease subunit [Rhizobium sp. SEMIA 4085]TDW32816.1 TRAP-type mannitol/chloroaromatic compound transport system permease small subunit [Rhizobium azibense]
MAGLLSLSRVIDAINTFLGKSVSWLLLAAVLISAVNATTRKLFNLSSNAWLEAQWYLFSAAFLIAAAWTLLSSEHVKVDLVYGQLPRRAQLWIEILGTIFFLLPFCLITIYLSWPIVVSKFVSGEISNNTGGLLLWPVWALIPAGFGLLALQGLSELIKRIAILKGDFPDAIALADAEAQTL